jgi:nucleotide-binding universal stress UspA family protein
MQKLIAMVDGSVYSASVCDHAAWISTRSGAAVDLLHVLGRRETSSTPTDLSGNIALGARSALLEELSALDERRARLAQKRGRAILADAEESLKAKGVENVNTKLRNGDIVATIAELEQHADMIVIGKRGEAADFAKLHLGSNLERVARSCSKPILVASRAFKPIRRFVIAFDGGKSSMKAVDHVASSNLFEGLDCRLLTVGLDGPEIRRKQEGAAALLKGAGLTVEATIHPGQADRVIAEFVENNSVDLAVMGAYGHSRIRTLVIGSTTTEMIRSCKIPILLFR